MDNYIAKLKEYLPKIEEFLTSVLLEETTVTVTNTEMREVGALLESLKKDDVYLFAKETNSEVDVLIILDNEWFALLSSIMLGVEERSLNEVTKDLLKKFTDELYTTLSKSLTEDGIEVAIEDIEVMKLSNLEAMLGHTEYQANSLEVEGLADENVHGIILFGNPEARPVAEEPEPEESEAEMETAAGNEMSNGEVEEQISGSYIEFEDFGEDTLDLVSEDGKSMDMLRDVEMNVSVELGRIELPLGRVLQLAKGSVIELDKLAGEPVDILVNGQRIAQGEVVVIDEHFGVRISSLVTTRQQLVKIN
ncbi:MAG: flagellar motor switch protein FliN [Balneolales bacterium]|nr:flagellar motor switch protein FliN [Balneolales bacterium]